MAQRLTREYLDQAVLPTPRALNSRVEDLLPNSCDRLSVLLIILENCIIYFKQGQCAKTCPMITGPTFQSKLRIRRIPPHCANALGRYNFPLGSW